MTTNELYLFRPLLRFLGEKMLNDADEVNICLNHCFAIRKAFRNQAVCTSSISYRIFVEFVFLFGLGVGIYG